MKKNKLNLIVLFATTVSLLAGCNDNDRNVGIVGEECQGFITGSTEEQVEAVLQEKINEENVGVVDYPGILAYSVDGKLRDRIQQEIEIARTFSPEHSNPKSITANPGSLYRQNKIDEIQSFYCIDRLEIPGYELVYVEMFASLFRYYYAPKPDENGQRKNSGILEITVCNPNYEWKFDVNNYYWRDEYRIYDIKDGYEIRDGFAYRTDGRSLTGAIDSIGVEFTIFSPQNTSPEVIEYVLEQWQAMRDQMSEEDFQEGLDYIAEHQVPEEYGTYEFLRDLAFRVIESAELVTVE